MYLYLWIISQSSFSKIIHCVIYLKFVIRTLSILFNSFQERLRKLESERGALHMEVSVLSEQVDAQSSKIQELESILQEKKDSLRQMEEALQKVGYDYAIIYCWYRA